MQENRAKTDQTVLLRRLISLRRFCRFCFVPAHAFFFFFFSFTTKSVLLQSLATQKARSEDSDLIGLMPRLICVFARRTAILLVLSCCASNQT